VATGLIYETSPEYIIDKKLLWHPGVLLGECVEEIGDATLHPPPERRFETTGKDSYLMGGGTVIDKRHDYRAPSQGFRAVGHGRFDMNYEMYNNGKNMYPLWNAADIRSVRGGRQIAGV